MIKLVGKKVKLRAIEPSDVEVLYKWENDPSTWHVSNTITPFSRHLLEQYIVNSHLDIYSLKQLRLVVCNKRDKTIGFIDLFDFDPHHRRAGIGILIGDKDEREKGYAFDALELLITYSFNVLHLNQLYCNISVDNKKSISLFNKHGFKITGTKKQWTKKGSDWLDEHTLQLLVGG